MELFSSDLIRPLYIAENNFLEVLISRFTLRRRKSGSELEVKFDKNTPAIWTRHAKYEVQKRIPNFQHKAAAYQQALDAFLLEGQGNSYEFNDQSFPFRYVSGGTLPVLRYQGEEYYCLFYRDIFPVGWNIANGGSDTREELLNPADTIERELREELIIVDPRNRKRYVFAEDAGKPIDRPEFAVARRIWQKRFGQLNFPKFEELVVPLKWLDGTDSVRVQIGKDPPKVLEGCFLNINAEDFGIEVDKIAKINLDKDAILCDGEITGNNLVNEIVGLFQVDRLIQELDEGRTGFFPDFFFYNATRYKRKKLEHVLQGEFHKHITRIRSAEENGLYKSTKKKFDLCPVTRRIISRYSSQTGMPTLERGPLDVFISSGGEDWRQASKVYDFLTKRDIKAFFYKETKRDPYVLRAIDQALDSANCLIAVGTKPENLTRPWVDFEWRSFFHDILLK